MANFPDHGFADMVAKPYKSDTLRRVIERALRDR